MADHVTHTTSQGWFGRIIESIKGIVFGLVLFVVAFPLLFWNEGRAVKRAQDLEEGRGAVVTATADAIQPAHEGSLVHLSGNATTAEALGDTELGPTAPGSLRLRRTVEMYQWTERKETRSEKTIGGSKQQTTTYTYALDWKDNRVDSSRFREQAGHINPTMPVWSQDFDAQTVTVGARALSPELRSQLDRYQPMSVEPATAPGLSRLGRPLARTEQGIFVGANASTPQLGDLRVRWERIPEGAVSILAKQQGNTFADWQTPSGRTLEQNLEMGNVSANDMFTTLETGNAVITWVLRFVGWLVMFMGIAMVVKPLVIVADVLPFLGSLVGAGTTLFAFVVSAPLSLLTISVGWIVYRPLLGIALLLVAGGIAFGVGKLAAARGKAKNQERQAVRVSQNPPVPAS